MQAVYPSTETLTNRGISNRVITKMMQLGFYRNPSEIFGNLTKLFARKFKNDSEKYGIIEHTFPYESRFIG